MSDETHQEKEEETVEGELADDALAGVQGGQMGPPLWQLTRGPSPWDAT
jgi:hypothetical protein